MNKLILTFCFLSLFSCKKEGGKTIKKIETPNTKIDTVKTSSLIVLKDGSLIVPDWVELVNFQEELKSVSTQVISSEKELEQLINLLSRLKETLPEKFKTPIINARIKVLETELLMFNQFVKEQDFKAAEIRKTNLQEAYNLVISQMEALLIKEKDYEKYK